MPAYREYTKGKAIKKINPVSYKISPYGISFPSAATLSKDDVDYVYEVTTVQISRKSALAGYPAVYPIFDKTVH